MGESDKTRVGGPMAGLSLDAIAKLVQTIGSLTVLGTVLGAAAFGVGYLAVKQHDEMLGVISTTSYALYVRTGVEFLPRTLHAIALYLGASVVPVVAGIALVTLIAVVRALMHRTAPSPRLERALQWWPLLRLALVASMAAVGVGLLSSQLAPLDVINTSLLLNGYRPQYEQAPSEASEVYRLLHEPAVDNARLEAADGREPPAATLLLMKYGKKALVAAGFVYLTILVTGSSPHAAPLGAAQRRVLVPMLLLVSGVLVLSLPLLYGVLAMPTTLPCVVLVTPAVKDRKEPELAARALSDLSGDVQEIVLFRWGDANERTAYSLERVGAKSVTQVNGDHCEDGNVLAEKVNSYRIDSLMRAEKAALAEKTP